LVLYVRLFAILGFTWVFGLATVLVPNEDEEGSWKYSLEQVLIYLYVIFSGLQGFFIFVVFTANKRVFGLYKNLLFKLCCKRKMKRKQSEPSSSTSCKCKNGVCKNKKVVESIESEDFQQANVNLTVNEPKR